MEVPVTRQEFDALKKRMKALEDWTVPCTDKVKALEKVAAFFDPETAAKLKALLEKSEEPADDGKKISWD